MSRYDNVFHYYRGPTRAADESTAERQVEDNSTKALINTLAHSDPVLAYDFVREFLAPGLAVDVPPTGRVSCYLQGRPTNVTDPTSLVGVSLLGEIDPATCAAPPGTRGRVDAAVHLPGVALLLIEVKVVDRLDWQQLRRHAEDAGVQVMPCSSPEGWPDDAPWRLVRWSEIYQWLHGTLAHYVHKDRPPTRFLLEQLLEYLDFVGLAPFTGFPDVTFDFFAAPVADRTWERQREVKSRLTAFWTTLLSQLSEDERLALGEVKVGTLPLDSQSAWGQTHAGTDGVNLTLEVWESELQLDLVAWRVSQADVFRRWLMSSGPDKWLSSLADYEVVIFRRRAHHGPSGNPYWQRETFVEVERCRFADLDQVRSAVTAQEGALDARWEKLAFHLRHAWPRAEVVALRDAILDEVRPRLVELAPLVPEIDAALAQKS